MTFSKNPFNMIEESQVFWNETADLNKVIKAGNSLYLKSIVTSTAGVAAALVYSYMLKKFKNN